MMTKLTGQTELYTLSKQIRGKAKFKQ
jgi:hypothetical protein